MKKPKTTAEVANKDYLVFISHSSKDRWIARQMANLIEQRCAGERISIFLDEKNILAGDPITDAVRANLQACAEFVVLLSRYSIESQWVLIETGAAWIMEKRIIAVLNNITYDQLPDIIRNDKAIDLNEFDGYLEQLLQRIASVQL